MNATSYSTTNNLHIQGQKIYTWLDKFVYHCEQLDTKEKETYSNVVLSQPVSLTPLKLLNSSGDNQLFEDTDRADCLHVYEEQTGSELICMIFITN